MKKIEVRNENFKIIGLYNPEGFKHEKLGFIFRAGRKNGTRSINEYISLPSIELCIQWIIDGDI